MYGTNTFWMYYTAGWQTQYIKRATSSDLITWTADTSYRLTNYAHSCQLLITNSIWCYGTAQPAVTSVDLFVAADLTNFVKVATNVLSCGAAGTWDAAYFGNSAVYQESSNLWWNMYDAKSSTNNAWFAGIAQSTDGVHWVKSAANPLNIPPYGLGITAGGSCADAWITKTNGYYVAFGGYNDRTYMTRIGMWTSPDMTNWTQKPYPCSLVSVREASEGGGSATSQMVDPSLIEYNGATYMFFTCMPTQGTSGANGYIMASKYYGTIGSLPH